MSEQPHWYASVAGPNGYQRTGPMARDVLQKLIDSRGVPADVLVWHPSLPGWERAGAVGFVPPPPAEAPAGSPSSAASGRTWSEPARPQPRDQDPWVLSTGGSAAHPWRRYLARNFDYVMLGTPLFLVLTVLLSAVSPRAGAWVASLKEFELTLYASVVMVFSWAAIEALLLSTVGTTPGKAIWGVRVRDGLGRKLTFVDALLRAVGVAMTGLAFGIPLIAMATQLVAYERVKKSGIASWDTGHQVSHRVYSPARWIGVVIAAISILLMFGLWSALGQEVSKGR